jgi:hypothetical protein
MNDKERLDVINHLRKTVDENQAAGILTECKSIGASKPDPTDIGKIIGTLTKDDEYINNNYEGDYFILKNPNRSLNKLSKRVLRVTFIVSIAGLIVQGINLWITKSNQDLQRELKKQEQHSPPPTILIDSVVVHHFPKDS